MYFSVHTLKNLMSLDDSFMLEAHQLSESDVAKQSRISMK